jgi:hypothetical protein
MISSKYIKYTEQLNALDYLEKSFCFLKSVEKYPQNWKWVIITIHSAIYGFSISASRGLNSESVVAKNKKGYDKLITFGKALERCQNPNLMSVNINYEYFEFTEQQKGSLNWLQNIFRNNFEHFKPKVWLIEIHDMPLMILDCLDVLRLLIVYSDIRWRLKSTKYRKAKSLVYQSNKIIKNSVLYNESIILRNKIKK